MTDGRALVLHLQPGATRVFAWLEQRSQGAPVEGLHPGACPADWLGGFGVAEGTPGEARLLLPTDAAGLPLASPGLLASAPQDGALSWGLWRVPGVWFEAEAARRWLLLSGPGREPGNGMPGLAEGPAVAGLRALASWATRIAGQGRVLPALSRGEARWRPLVGQERARQIGASWPPLVRALVPDDAEPPASHRGRVAWPRPTGPVLATRWFLRWVDGAVRSAGGADQAVVAGAALDPVGRMVCAFLGEAPGPIELPEELPRRLARWTGPARSRPVLRLVFRLAEPMGNERGSWQLKLLLQAREDRSLLVEADDVWLSGPRQKLLAGWLRRSGTALSPGELLLSELARASRLVPALRAGFGGVRPTGWALSDEEAWAFLRGHGALLAQSDFGVQLPAWAGRGRSRVSLRLHAPGGGLKGLLGKQLRTPPEWQLLLDGAPVGEAELTRLALLKRRLVAVRGRWVELEPASLERAIDYLGKLRAHDEDPSPIELLRAGLGVEAPDGVEVAAPVLGGPVGALLSGRSQPDPAPAPAGFMGTLRPYQARGLGWLQALEACRLGACLADDMGLGKTIQALALVLSDTDSSGPTLVLCPTSVLGNWQNEAARFAPGLDCRVHHGTRRSRSAEPLEQADLVLTSYALALRDGALLQGIRWRRVILDEAHTIKNPRARISRLVRALSADQRLALTGTPVENQLTELWALFEFLNPGLLGPLKTFRDRFSLPIEREDDPRRSAQLRRLVGPFLLRRRKDEAAIAAELPERIELVERVGLTREQATLYRAVVDELLEKRRRLEGSARRGLVLGVIGRLKQLCNHPALYLGDGSALEGRSQKLDRLEQLLREALAVGDRCLVFTQYATFATQLAPWLAGRLGREVLLLTGATPRAQRDADIARFQAGGAEGPPVYLLSLKAGGTGLNLTAASQVIHLDRWWNPAAEQQASDRVHRIGQTRRVQIRWLMTTGTLEEKIEALINRKRRLSDGVVDRAGRWELDALDEEGLRALLALTVPTPEPAPLRRAPEGKILWGADA